MILEKLYTVATVPADSKNLSQIIFILDPGQNVPKEYADEAAAWMKKAEFKPKPGKIFTFDSLTLNQITIAYLPKVQRAFEWLGFARKVIQSAKIKETTVAHFYLNTLKSDRLNRALDALLSAYVVGIFPLPQYKKKPPKKNMSSHCTFIVPNAELAAAAETAKTAAVTAEATNRVRELATLPGNYLLPSSYVSLAGELAKEHGLKSEFISYEKLKSLGAGAFCAVAQGANDKGSGIFKVEYSPKTDSNKRVAVVGKGLTYDTGGNNLKTGGYMYGMHEDMTGSAVALAYVLCASKLKLPYQVTAYLAITENVLSPQAFRPNDVIHSLSGKTIEIIDTDAEGRMVLADTLHLAAKENPSVIVDFATLTGSCVRALGTRYSGVYSNRTALLNVAKKAGFASGERVWPLPNSDDFGQILKSEVADIKQCRKTGGPDHIEAGYFLKQFVGKKVPWVHVDLSSHINEGGLAHVESATNGFGIRWCYQFLNQFFA